MVFNSHARSRSEVVTVKVSAANVRVYKINLIDGDEEEESVECQGRMGSDAFLALSVVQEICVIYHIQGGAGGLTLGLGRHQFTSCHCLLGQMGIWLNRLCSWAKWLNISNLSQPRFRQEMGLPVQSC